MFPFLFELSCDLAGRTIGSGPMAGIMADGYHGNSYAAAELLLFQSMPKSCHENGGHFGE